MDDSKILSASQYIGTANHFEALISQRNTPSLCQALDKELPSAHLLALRDSNVVESD
jgi:hypothetical protein